MSQDIIQEKIIALEEHCEDIYSQITDLRNSIQNLYGEYSENSRVLHSELFRLSERLETMSRDLLLISTKTMKGEPVIIHNSPQINPIISPSNKINSENTNLSENKNDDDPKDIPVSSRRAEGFLTRLLNSKKPTSIFLAFALGSLLTIAVFIFLFIKICSIL